MALQLNNLAKPETIRDPIRQVVYVGTGVSQHVFISSKQPSGQLVYKIPASFGYLRPFTEFLRESPRLVKRTRLSSRAIMSLLDRTSAGSRLIAAFLKRKRAQEFGAMLDVLDHVGGTPARAALLPYRVSRNIELALQLGDVNVSYRGPALIQARAMFLRADPSPFACDWRHAISEQCEMWARAIIAAQHTLWSYGIGIADSTEILGPSEWALWRGRVRLGDTGNLRRSFDQVHDALDERRVNRTIEDVLNEAGSTWAAPTAKYFGLIRKHINQRRLLELWKSALPQSASSDGRVV
jgi:hypothetical protein